MKRFQECPICKVGFKQVNTSPSWFEEICKNHYTCPAEFRQYFDSSFDEEDISYIHFYTKTFNFYTYYTSRPDVPAGMTHIYFNKFPRGEFVQSPAFRIQDMKIDWDNYSKLDERVSIWNLLR